MNKEMVERARTALDNMDDYARMNTGVDAIGPRKVLEDFIEAAAKVQEMQRIANLEREWKVKKDCDCGCNTPSFTEPFEALRFLMHRMNYAGIGDAVGQSYAHDIYQILKKHDQLEVND